MKPWEQYQNQSPSVKPWEREWTKAGEIAPESKPGLIERARSAISGDDRRQFNLDAITSGLPGASENTAAAGKVALALASGNDEDVLASIARNFPDLVVQFDTHNNPMISKVDLETGHQSTPVYINRPGLDADDLKRATAQIAAFMTPVGALSKIKGGVKAIGAAGAAEAGVDAVLQKVAGRDEIDAGQVAVSGLFGAGGEIVGRTLGAARDWWRARKGGASKAAEEGAQIAREMGLNPSDMNREQLATLKYLEQTSDSGVTDAAKIAKSEFGYQPTAGQATGDYRQLRKEEMILNSPNHGNKLRSIMQQSEARTDEILGELQKKFNPASHGDQMEAAGAFYQGLKDQQKMVGDQVDDAYAAARGHSASVAREAVDDLPSRLEQRLMDDAVVVDSMLTPGAKRALKDVRKFIGAGDGAVDFAEVERQRRRLRSILNSAGNKEDKRAVGAIIKEYDSWLDDAFDNAMFSGDREALDAIKNARELRTKYGKLFESDTEAGKVVQKMLAEERTPEQVLNYVIGANTASKAGSANIVKQLKRVVGQDSPAFNALREAAFLRMVTKKTGDRFGGQTLINQLKAGLQGGGKSLMKELYSPEELGKISRFVQALETMQARGMLARSSGTAERLFAWGENVLGLPFISKLRGMKLTLDESAATRIPSKPQRIEAAPGAAAGAASVYSSGE